MKKMNVTVFATTLCCLLLFLMCVSAALFSPQISQAVKAAVDRCLNVIIPSMFAFMALSQMFLQSGAAARMAGFIHKLLKYILPLPSELLAVLLISQAAGYPVGAKLISQLYEDGKADKRTAELMLGCCYCGGPAFYMGTVGLTVFGSSRAGVLIFLSLVISNLVMALFIARLVRPRAVQGSCKVNITPRLMTDCILSAGRSLFTVCVMIVFFAALMSVAEALGLWSVLAERCTKDTAVTVKAFFEITSLAELNHPSYKLLPVMTALCSFGGVCIVLQLQAVKSNGLSLRYFWLTRPAAAVLSAAACRLLMPCVLPKEIPAMAQNKILLNVNNFWASICLILMIFLLNLKKSLVISE